MIASRRIRAVTLVVIACGAVAWLGIDAPSSPTAAATASDTVDVLVSADGTHFATYLDAGLFDNLGVLVPTGAVTATLWIRNPTDSAAELRVSTRNVRMPSGAFADDVTMLVWDSGTADTRSSALGEVAACGIVVPAQTIGPGATVAMTITFAMSDLPEAVNQGESATFDLVVAMQEAGATTYPTSACGDDGTLVSGASAPGGGSGTLAQSGAAGVGLLWPLAGVLVGLGVFLYAGRRRAVAP